MRHSWRESDKLCQRGAADAVSAQLTPERQSWRHGLRDPEGPRSLGGTAWHVASGCPHASRNWVATRVKQECFYSKIFDCAHSVR